MISGSCLCGTVTFEVSGELAPIQICHCTQCRKAQGSAFVTNTPVKEADFTLLSGADQIGAFESSPGKQRCFCKNCGSPVYSKTQKLPGVIRLRAGTLDGDLNVRPEAHYYVADKANWYCIEDDLPQFSQWRE